LEKLTLTIRFILFLIIFIAGCGDESMPPSEQKSPEYEGVIVAVGDSLTEGLGVGEEFAYPALLEKKLQSEGYHYRVINAGVSGETSSGTLARINWILKLKPDIVILVIGANDGFRGIDPDTNLIPFDPQDGDRNIAPDHDRLTSASRQNKHDFLLLPIGAPPPFLVTRRTS